MRKSRRPTYASGRSGGSRSPNKGASSALNQIAAPFGLAGADLMEMLMTMVGPAHRVSGDVTSLTWQEETLVIPRKSLFGVVLDLAANKEKAMTPVIAIQVGKAMFSARKSLLSTGKDALVSTLGGMSTAHGGSPDPEAIDRLLKTYTEDFVSKLKYAFE